MTHVTHATDGTAPDSSPTSRPSPVSRSTSPVVTYDAFRRFEDRPAEVRASIRVPLIHQANYLLDQQLRQLERDFLKRYFHWHPPPVKW